MSIEIKHKNINVHRINLLDIKIEKQKCYFLASRKSMITIKNLLFQETQFYKIYNLLFIVIYV